MKMDDKLALCVLIAIVIVFVIFALVYGPATYEQLLRDDTGVHALLVPPHIFMH